MLLDAGADLNHRDDTGSTALLQLAFQNDYKRALTLVRRGADVNVEMVNGTSLRLLIERYPLPPASPQGMAQAEMKRLLR